MPHDEWRKARDRDIANQDRREFASTRGWSSFPHVWDDRGANPIVQDTAIAKRKRKKRKRPKTECPHCGDRILKKRLEEHFAKCPKHGTKSAQRDGIDYATIKPTSKTVENQRPKSNRQLRRAANLRRQIDGLLETLSESELLAFALEEKQDELHQWAKSYISKRKGRSWKSIRKEQAELARSIRPASTTMPVTPAPKKTIIPKRKKRTISGDSGVKDYLMPMSKDYDMPEVDLTTR